MNDLQALLALEDGKVFSGIPFGAVEQLRQSSCGGEVIFTTAMTGYQEICTDPSYRKQIVVMTYPLIGNYGVARDAVESGRPWLTALVVHDLCEVYSHWQATESLDTYLMRHNIPALSEVDTRALTRYLKQHGTIRGILHAYTAEEPPDKEALIQAARQICSISAENVVGEVSLSEINPWYSASSKSDTTSITTGVPRVIIIDTGFKFSIARYLAGHELEILLVPYTISPQDLLALHPHGIVLSNGPGDPAVVHDLIRLVRCLIPSGLPLLGICLGHQILGLAAGARCSKLMFGHHGTNHPVKDVRTGRVTITSQNHNFQVDAASVPTQNGFHISHINLLDQSVEGLYHEYYPISSIQYHPEASPGPRDNLYLLDAFVAQVRCQVTTDPVVK